MTSLCSGLAGAVLVFLTLSGALGQPSADPAVSAEGCATSALPPTSLPPVAGDDAFPTGYIQARDRFRADCKRLQDDGISRCATHVIAPHATAPDAGVPRTIISSRDPDLSVETAYASRQGNSHLLVLQSGLHGVEAFAGAAVQRDLMNQQVKGILDRGFDVLLIHAINPYGFSNLRRVDACNVDLNRNFPQGSATPRRTNAPYARLRDITEDPDPVASVPRDSFDSSVRTVLRLLGGLSTDEIAEGTHAGQYVDPAGFEFGGQQPAEQVALLRDLLVPLVGTHTGRIYFLDLHTGLGPANTLTVFSGRAWTDPKHPGNGPLRFEALDAFLKDVEGTKAVTASGGPFETFGDVIDFVPTLGPSGQVVALTLEWGTVGETSLDQLQTNARMLLEHRAHFRGCRSEAVCVEVKRDFVALFNPDDPTFRAAVLRQARQIVDRLTARLPDFRSAGPR